MRNLLLGKMFMVSIVSMHLVLSFVSGAGADQTVTTNHNYISVANAAGVKYNNWDYSYYLAHPYGGGTIPLGYNASTLPGAGANAYLIKADGGGTNELGIGTSSIGKQVTTITTNSNNPSGTFYINNTGGRGFDNDIILALSVTGPISDNFSVNIKSSGYTWIPDTPGNYTPSATGNVASATHIQGLNETFRKTDFIYGPQLGRPGTGAAGTGTLSNFSSEAGALTTSTYLMFIDLKVGNISPGKVTLPGGFVDDGAVKVEFSFSGLDGPTKIGFNSYGWCSASYQDEGINWTNAMTGAAASGYYLDATPTDTTYPTATISYSLAGPYKEGTVVTISATFSEAMKDSPVPMIALSGAATVGATNMTKVSSTFYTYSYTVGSGNGDVSVSLSTGTDLDGNTVRPTPTSGATFTIDNTPPTVSAFTPADGATDVDTGRSVKVTFSEPMDPLTVTGSTFYINGVSATPSYDAPSRTATIVPPQQLANSTVYNVTVSWVKDLAGNLLSSPVNWAFTTTAAPDTTPPTAAISYSPAGPYKAGTVVTITTTFSEAMATSPIPRIALSGAATLAAADMTRVDTNKYTYSYTVGSGDGDVTVNLSNGTDMASTPNPVVSTPTGGATFTIDNTPPTVSSFTPANGANNVDTGSLVKVIFSEPMDPLSITSSTLYINGVSGTIGYDAPSRTATITPAQQLANATGYDVTVSGVKDLAGNVLSTPVTSSFTTAGVPDTTPPTANLSYSPGGPYASGAVVTINATFSEAIAVSAPPKIALSGAASLSPTDMTRIDTSHYTYVYTVGSGNGDVTVTLSNGTDLAGNSVTSTPTSGGTFTIDNTPPAVLSVSPADGASEISINSSITSSFNEVMDKPSINSSTFTVNGVTGTVTYDPVSRIATFSPKNPLNYGTKYTATLTTGIKDKLGNAMTADKTWTFTTVPLYGDLKGSGEALTVADALIALRIAAGFAVPTSQQMAVGDVAPLVGGQPHPDGKIDISDVVVILMKVVGQLSW